jgi:hypothetical protein
VNVPLHADGVTLDLLRDWIEVSYRTVAPRRLVTELDRRTSHPGSVECDLGSRP